MAAKDAIAMLPTQTKIYNISWKASRDSLEALDIADGEAREFSSWQGRLGKTPGVFIANPRGHNPLKIIFYAFHRFKGLPLKYKIQRFDARYELHILWSPRAEISKLGGLEFLQKHNINAAGWGFAKRSRIVNGQPPLPSSKDLSEDELKKLLKKY
jgi:hypothetical protein